MQPTYDLRIKAFEPLISPETLKKELPMSPKAIETVTKGRQAIEAILHREDQRLLVVTGPCSIHDEGAALEYARRLVAVNEQVKETMLLVMRVYFEKPRTNVGWKGLINDPWLDGSCDIGAGLRKARQLLLEITEMGLPTATELLDPIIPQYIAGLLCWAAIGARTTESQTHREMASGLSMPVGFKNCTDGGLNTAINGIIAATSPQSFLGIDPEGFNCVVKTTGNLSTHIVLRGGRRPNYDTVSIQEAIEMLRSKGVNEAIMVDCSHANSRKNHEAQAVVWQDVINQRLDGNDALVGLMLESHLNSGKQAFASNQAVLDYGVSITDACISWEATEQLLLSTHTKLKQVWSADHEGTAREKRYKVA